MKPPGCIVTPWFKLHALSIALVIGWWLCGCSSAAWTDRDISNALKTGYVMGRYGASKFELEQALGWHRQHDWKSLSDYIDLLGSPIEGGSVPEFILLPASRGAIYPQP